MVIIEHIYRSADRHNISLDNAYTYEKLIKDIHTIKEDFPGITLFTIGKSFEGRNLYSFKIGAGSRKILLCGAHHGMEWLTAKICMEFGRELCLLSELSTSVYIVPMLNPDGVAIASHGLRWQANARGVDLNHNYDALWSLSRMTENKCGITCPCASRYGGEYPESEPESRALADFTRENCFDAVFALHSTGSVIYYDFCGIVPPGTEEYLARFEASSSYVRDIPAGTAVYGGFKDWFIRRFRKPGFTIEVGQTENPLPLSDFNEVYDGVRGILWETVR